MLDETKQPELTLNGRKVTKEKLDEQKQLAEKTGAKVVEKKPGQFQIHLNE